MGKKEGVASWAEGEKGERANLAPWAEMAFLFSSAFLISFLFLAPLYLLPRALGWYTCVAYHVFTQVGSTMGLGIQCQGLASMGIDLQGRSIDFMN